MMDSNITATLLSKSQTHWCGIKLPTLDRHPLLTGDRLTRNEGLVLLTTWNVRAHRVAPQARLSGSTRWIHHPAPGLSLIKLPGVYISSLSNFLWK